MWNKLKSNLKYLVALIILGVSAMFAYLWQKDKEKLLTLGKEHAKLKAESKVAKLKEKKIRLEVKTELVDKEIKEVDKKLRELEKERIVVEETDIDDISKRADNL